MKNIIKAEFLKSRRTTTNKFIVITPLLSILLSYVWGGGQNGAYNWWYTMFLPGMLAIISAQIMTREKSLSYKAILLYPQDKSFVWLGKILYISILLVCTSLIFMIATAVFGFLHGSTIPLGANMFATIILILTFLFNVPISMFLTVQFNIFVTVLFNVAMTIIGVVSYTSSNNFIFNILPYKTSSGLMALILHILPNGLPVPENSPLRYEAGDMICKETVISLIAFIIFTVLTTIWFRIKEVK